MSDVNLECYIELSYDHLGRPRMHTVQTPIEIPDAAWSTALESANVGKSDAMKWDDAQLVINAVSLMSLVAINNHDYYDAHTLYIDIEHKCFSAANLTGAPIGFQKFHNELFNYNPVWIRYYSTYEGNDLLDEITKATMCTFHTESMPNGDNRRRAASVTQLFYTKDWAFKELTIQSYRDRCYNIYKLLYNNAGLNQPTTIFWCQDYFDLHGLGIKRMH